jgi:hypothetical protein
MKARFGSARVRVGWWRGGAEMGPQGSQVPSGPLRWGHGHRESGGAKELWDRLQNEPEGAYLAFEAFLALPGGHRTILAAYRNHVANPCAAKPSDTWSGWSSRFAWRERAAAYDAHIFSLRREASERAIEEEAKRHARLVERMRYETMEELSALHVGVMGYLENLDWSSIRTQDVIQILKLKLDAAMRFEEAAQARGTGQSDASRIGRWRRGSSPTGS